MEPQDVVGLAVASALGRVANRVFSSLVPANELVDGFPRWRWLLGCATQAFIFPMFVAWALAASVGTGVSAIDWLALPAGELPSGARWYVYALCASQTRDMFPMPAEASTTMKVHHWVVVIASVLSLISPRAFGLFVMGTFLLELGSLTFNLRTLYPKSAAINVLYQICMFLSNLAALVCGLLLLQIDIPMWMKLLYFAADVGVCIGRQLHALKDGGCIRRKHMPKHGAKAAPENGANGVTNGSAAADKRGASRDAGGSMRPRHGNAGGGGGSDDTSTGEDAGDGVRR